MNTYDPSIAPVPEDWLAHPEDERIELVRAFHKAAGENQFEVEQLEAHAALHVVVENQIAMEFEPVPATVEKLIRQGLNRHEAIHAIAAVLSGELWQLQHQEQSEWESGIYRRKLEKLTAKRWRKGQY